MNLLSLPVHPLVVHAAVVAIPTAAVLSVCFVLRRDWRWALRLPTAVLDVLAVVVLFVTRATGDQLAHATSEHKDLIERHDQLAGLLTISFLPLALLSLLACWSFGSGSALASSRGQRDGSRERLVPAVTWLVVLLAAATLVLTVLTGHAGAVATWSSSR
ncbi:DUF2231 domain-containing protein [Luteococcus peritonei]|uniref:DUF2231 domain-containing protein n=1 Tax=Luteococcus peritonei TaxID=88874 RepID=A0ABW4S0H9_9ACTN